MKIILTKQVNRLGKRNEEVTVKDGYAVNWLIPQGLALPATKTNRKRLEHQVKLAQAEAQKIEKEARKIVNRAKELHFVIPVESSGERVFGAITPLQISLVFKEYGLEIEPQKISIPTPIRTTGVHSVLLTLAQGIVEEISIEVVAKG